MSTDENKPDEGPPQRDTQAEGDFRGPYGYGRPAYKPDPNATYVFDPGMVRVLPVRPKSRWR